MRARYSPRFESALALSARAHARQLRKGTDLPYLTHPVHVAWLLSSYGFDEDVVIAGLLHDLLEDTWVQLGEIRATFGPRVASIVEACSEPDHDWAGWEDRKSHTVQAMRAATDDVRAVTCADKLHNLSTIRDDLATHGETVWRRFHRGIDRQAWYYRALVASLGERWDHPMLDELRAVVEEVFGPSNRPSASS